VLQDRWPLCEETLQRAHVRPPAQEVLRNADPDLGRLVLEIYTELTGTLGKREARTGLQH
jgi:hypothetical protein